MKMMANTSVPICNIKDEIASSLGRTITVKVFNKQRKLTNQFTGLISAVYDSVFLVDISVNQYHINKSLAYVNFSIGDMSYELA